MDNRIIKLLSQLADKTDNISESFRVEEADELFFKYRGCFFSMVHGTKRPVQYGPYSLYIYPRWTGSLRDLAQANFSGIADEPVMVSYHSADFDSGDQQIFRAAYNAILSKSLGVDDVLAKVLD